LLQVKSHTQQGNYKAEIQSNKQRSHQSMATASIFVCKKISYLFVFASARSQKFQCRSVGQSTFLMDPKCFNSSFTIKNMHLSKCFGVMPKKSTYLILGFNYNEPLWFY